MSDTPEPTPGRLHRLGTWVRTFPKRNKTHLYFIGARMSWIYVGVACTYGGDFAPWSLNRWLLAGLVLTLALLVAPFFEERFLKSFLAILVKKLRVPHKTATIFTQRETAAVRAVLFGESYGAAWAEAMEVLRNKFPDDTKVTEK